MEALEKKIQNGIENKKYATVFHADVERICGRKIEIEAGVKKAVDDFARRHGWKARIGGAGLRVTFKKAA